MAKPFSLSTSGASVSSVGPMNLFVAPFSASVITVVTGSVVYTLQFTGDNPQAAAFNPATANWQDHPMMTGATTSGIVEFTSPVVAVRINQASGAGSVAAKVIQAGV